MSTVALHGGPPEIAGQNLSVSSALLRGDEIRVKLYNRHPPKLSLRTFSVPVMPDDRDIRTAVYRIRDSESAVADWVGWEDEIPSSWPGMTQALGNASDDEILKLLDDLSKAER